MLSRTSAIGLSLLCFLRQAPSHAQTPFPIETSAPSSAPPDLSAIPLPVIERLEPAVQSQLRSARQRVEDAAAEPSDRDPRDAALGRLCLLYLRYELLDAAVPCLDQMRALRPSDFQWPYYQAVLFSQRAEIEAARKSLESARELRPNDVPSLLRLGNLHLLGVELELAQEAFEAALLREPRSSAAHFGLGRTAAARGQAQEAIEHFRVALDGQPSGSIVHHHLGMAYRAIGDLDRARQELAKNRQQAIAFSDPLLRRLDTLSVSREGIFVRGVEASRQGQPRQAIEAFREVLELEPDDAEAHFNLAQAQIAVGDLEEAETHLREALQSWPGFFDAHFNLAVLLGRLGREQEAAQHLEKAVGIDPDHLPTRVLWARQLAQQGRSLRAVEELEAVLRIDPAEREANLALADLQDRLGNFTEAAARFGALVALSPEDARAHLGRARNLILAGFYRRARAALESSTESLPGDRALRHLLARFLATCPDPELRDGERALDLAQKVIDDRLTVDHADTLAMALAELGRFEEAVQWQRRVLRQEEAATGTASAQRQHRLDLYELGRAARAPWLDDKP